MKRVLILSACLSVVLILYVLYTPAYAQSALAQMRSAQTLGWSTAADGSAAGDIFIGRSGTKQLFIGASSAGTNPVMTLDQATASAITGVKVTSAASGGGVTIDALGGTNETLIINAKGSGSANHVSLNSGAFRVRNDGLVINSTATTWNFTPITTSTSAGITGSIFTAGAASAYAFSSNRATTDANDGSIYRLAAGVVGIGSGGASGSGWLQNSAGRARLTANATNATATMASITDLTIPQGGGNLPAGRKYFGRIVFLANDSTGADGLAFDFNGGTATMTNFQATAEEAPIGATLGVTNSTALGTALTNTVVGTGDVVYAFNVTFVVNGTGTVIPRFAQVAHTTGTATVKLGSSFFLEDSPN